MLDRTRWPRNAALVLATVAALGTAAVARAKPAILSGAAAFGDWTQDAPGTRRHITAADLPAPYATKSASNTGHIVPRPKGAVPHVPPGFTVSEFATGLSAPRLLRVAPNGDIFVAETNEGDIRVLHKAKDGKPRVSVYAKDLEEPFGLAFYPPGPQPQYLYVATADAVRRFPYRGGDQSARGKPEMIGAKLPTGGHSTRDVLFSADGKKMYVAVGSQSNALESSSANETRRADILESAPDGSGERRFATGLRNPVEMALHPQTGELWTVVNERDGLGDDLPPDYLTRVRDGAFYGWPWYYIGAHQDPRHQGEHPELRDRITVPDVLFQPHSAPLGLTVYTGKQFPHAYRNDIFVALHGSWNRARRTGYKVVRAILHDGKPTGEYEDFLTGFVTKEGDVWARPVGVAVAPDGALLVSDDAGGTIWRVAYTGAR